ncbi:hypothetical protein FPZ43_17405 [Mucilaginibacter pallidiroseus]|uniref:Uncharacterized protein n=1 Tax=Mucilaginibacter pallidiroseus TaxID=2599295 RepID=A0A563U0V9_9SPHI|nr:hypothetical protein [Mucilaginibacter pallidiroseus]TWR25246.1 hypothetical protein FPZ43_17405 [Mucilaginibacter pallidiroseus]
MDINGFTAGVERPDGSFINVEVEPVNIEIEGHLKSTGAYNLYHSHFGDDILSSRDRTDADYLGMITFSQEVEGDWMYEGNGLSDDEAEQIVMQLNGMMNEDDAEHSFSAPVYYKGGMVNVEIVPHDGKFDIYYAGSLLGQIHGREQIFGEPLDKDVLVTVLQAIDRYNQG